MISPARKIAYQVLCRVVLGGAFSDEMLSSGSLSALSERDRNLATEICYGTLRWQLSLDDILARSSSRTWESVDPLLRVILSMSLYQMQYTNRIPDHALVNDAVEIAKAELDRGKASFANGLLRSLARDRLWEKTGFEEARAPWIRASLPKWLWDRWSARYGSDIAFRFAVSLNRPPQVAVRLKTAGEVISRPALAGIPSEVVPGAWLVEKAPKSSDVWIQDEASQLIPHLLAPLSGSRVCDACAAPGGKSSILGSLCGKTGLLVSSDLRWKRASRMRASLEGFSSKPAAVVTANAACGLPFGDATFDAILADVPCSGLGTLRRNPEIKWRFRPENLDVLHKKQLSILTSVAGVLRVGGTLLYSTCSTEPEENEQVVETFLESRRDFRILRPKSPAGIERWLDAKGTLRTFPDERLWDGFFGALMLRVS